MIEPSDSQGTECDGVVDPTSAETRREGPGDGGAARPSPGGEATLRDGDEATIGADEAAIVALAAGAMTSAYGLPPDPEADAATVGPGAARGASRTVRTIGRYWVERCLGRGTFGAVYLARDGDLGRLVAIKVPHEHLAAESRELEGIVNEARILARLDHGAIVPIYDVARLDDGRPYIVAKFIDGESLAVRLGRDRAPREVVAEWIARAAEGLDFAHAAGIVHRDVKPANLLLDAAGRLFVADFGLALREAEAEGASGFAGTPAYTSPEQARREGHRVDARSDLFSLGVVMYEALTGRNPFRAGHVAETLHNIANIAPPPLRSLDPSVPSELERICLKAIAKRSDDRYESGRALADDLRHWLLAERDPTTLPARAAPLVPRGLRPFGAEDAEAYLPLVPGPRGRDGLPESVHFWKARIEGTEGGEPFAIGVVYGPAGSGKTSLVRAGLLPRLSSRVRVASVEATAEGTEADLARAVIRAVPGAVDASSDPDLAGLVRDLRRGRGLRQGEKVLIVLDGFERWLVGRGEEDRKALEEALRQCDGARVQALLIVRDEFWMDLTRFARAVEIRLIDGVNAAAVDLFDREHARRVLIALGRAYDRLPAAPKEPTAEQEAFLDRALEGLARGDRVICSRLTLLAEMLRLKPWTPTTLRALGGVDRLVGAILDEAFSAASSHPRGRSHRLAAREILARLLPERGAMTRPGPVERSELLRASGYGERPDEFDEVMGVLAHALRIVARVEPRAAGEPAAYQIADDALVPDLRAWLLRDRHQTIRGRAELRLQEFAALWEESPKASFLPSTWEWIVLVALTDPRRRTDPQRRMMRAAMRREVRHGLVAAVLLAVLGGVTYWVHGDVQARSRVMGLRSAAIDRVPAIAQELRPYRRWAVPVLRAEVDDPRKDERSRLPARLALAEFSADQDDILASRMIDANTAPIVSLTIRDVLAPRGRRLVPRLWGTASDARRPAASRFRAAMALAAFDPPSRANAASWKGIGDATADALLAAIDEWPSEYAPLAGAVGPIGGALVPRLSAVFRAPGDPRRGVATNLLLDLASDAPEVVVALALDGDADQFAKLLPLLDRHRSQVLPALRAAAARPDPRPPEDEAPLRSHRRAAAALALIRLRAADDAWPVFRADRDPRARTEAIHEAARHGVSIEALLDRLESEREPSAVAGLMIAVGCHPGLAARADEAREVASKRLDHPAPGVRGAAEWLVLQASGSPAPTPRAASPSADRGWFVTSEGHVMVIVDARKALGYAFAVATKETTLDQMGAAFPAHWSNLEVIADPHRGPANVVTWPEAIDYCLWLTEREMGKGHACYPAEGARGKDPLPDADLTRPGFRLPTPAEFEYATRAGTVTRRYYGDRDDLLPLYACFGQHAKIQAVGSRIPNDFGLFDVYGNLAEWTCERRDNNYIKIAGGAYHASPDELVSGHVASARPDDAYNSYGFRIVRTIELDDQGRPK